MPKTLSNYVFKRAQLPDTPSPVSNMVLNVIVIMPFIMAEPFLLTKMTVISFVPETVWKIAGQEAELDIRSGPAGRRDRSKPRRGGPMPAALLAGCGKRLSQVEACATICR